MVTSVKPLARKVPAAPLLFGAALVRLLPRHWTGRLIERCRVCERVVQDSVHARHWGKYRVDVHQAAIRLAFEHQHSAVLKTLDTEVLPPSAELATARAA